MTLKNTENNATMTLISLQTADGKTDRQEFASVCAFYKNNDAYYITYQEHQDMGMGNSRVFIKITEGLVTIRRMGDYKSVMSYEIGKITTSIYRFPFGQMDIKIKTNKIDYDFSEQGGRLKLNYSLFLGGGYSDNDIEINVTI